jgi:hypothetical protein
MIAAGLAAAPALDQPQLYQVPYPAFKGFLWPVAQFPEHVLRLYPGMRLDLPAGGEARFDPGDDGVLFLDFQERISILFRSSTLIFFRAGADALA